MMKRDDFFKKIRGGQRPPANYREALFQTLPWTEWGPRLVAPTPPGIKAVRNKEELPKNAPSRPSQRASKILFLCPLRPREKKQESFELWEKMISALKLQPEQFDMFWDFDAQESTAESLQKVLQKERPRYVMTFGGATTSLILNKRQRLQDVHGEWLTQTIPLSSQEQHSFEVFPLFHPDYLLINPKMKKIAWEDMKKFMKNLAP